MTANIKKQNVAMAPISKCKWFWLIKKTKKTSNFMNNNQHKKYEL